MSGRAGAFAREVVTAAGPANPARAKALLWACAKLASFAASVGLEADPAVVLHPSVIERFILIGCPEVSGASRRTLRTNLSHVAARVLVGSPAPVALSRERAKAPYSDAEIGAYLRLADAQPTAGRRMRAQGLICLGAGAGLTGADLRAVRGVDVRQLAGGLVVAVGGRRARVVPILTRYHDRARAAAGFAGSGFVIGGADPNRRNVTTPLISQLAGGDDLARVDLGRLRSTWLVCVAGSIGLKAFMDAAGITCSQRLGDLLADLPSPTPAQGVAVLGGLC
jgi:integrase